MGVHCGVIRYIKFFADTKTLNEIFKVKKEYAISEVI
jgi:hypothetical protein